MRFLLLTTCLCLGSSQGLTQGTPVVDGVWQSDGYGFVLDVQGSTVRLFSTGRGYCGPETGAFIPIEELLPGAEFVLAGDGQRLSIGLPMEPHRISARRLPTLPPACMTETSTDAVAVFEAFVGLFDSNYPFFALHGVDWPARVAEARQRVHVNMNDQSLFDELTWLMTPIQDGHVALIANIDGTRQISAPGRARIFHALSQAARATGDGPAAAIRSFRDALWYGSIHADLLEGDGEMVGNDHIQYGMLNEEIGYLAFGRLDGFGPVGERPEDALRTTQALLDVIMEDFATYGARSIILDLSLNFGGSDFIAREVASRFIPRTVFAYTKFAGDADTPIETRVSIEPSTGAQFGGDVVLLTSNVTVSAAEVLTIALRTQPHVIHVGEATRGAFSDTLSRTLPNGWQLNLSNEIYLDADGRHWEALGIPPDLEMPVFLETDPIQSHRQAIRRLLGGAS